MKAPQLAPAALLIVPTLVAGLYFAFGRGSASETVPGPPPRSVTSSAAAPAPSPAAPASATSASAFEKPPSDEAAGLAEIETLLSTNPERALAEIRDQNERFPNSELRDDRDYAGVRAWVNLGKIAKARSVATEFYTAHPDSPLVERVHSLTGMHLPPHLGP